MKFDYQARTRDGHLKLGQVEASSYEAALDILQKYGYYITFLTEAKEKKLWERELRMLKRLTRKEIVTFTRQLAILLVSQTPPVEALHTLAAQTENGDFKDKILKIAGEVEGGKPFSKALTLYPKIFSKFFVNIVKSGEASGELPKALNTLADHLERDYDLVAKIRAASIYPAFILITMTILVILMVYFVFPQLEKVFAESGKALPAITVFMLAFANLLRSWGWFIGLLIVVFIFFATRYIATPEGRRLADGLLITVPGVGSFMQRVYLSRFAENLSTLISGGLPIAQALETTSGVVNNAVYRKVVLAARDGVRRGESISSVFKRYPEIIPPLVTQMVFVGERSGQLDQVLQRMDEFYRKEVDLEIGKFVSLLEPVMIVALGIVVSFIILTILLPIYQIGII